MTDVLIKDPDFDKQGGFSSITDLFGKEQNFYERRTSMK
jgi:hypothetical protein